MAKLAQAAVKYTIYATFEADGYVEKPDVIGAIFGQTEGLLGPDLDLRELQRTGRIGRIEVKIENKDGKSRGVITIPTSLDSCETALIAAACETIERIGPCHARIRVEKIEDVRAEKRRYIVERAKELLRMIYDYAPEIEEISEELKEAVRTSEITEYKGLPAGPNIESADSIIIVEGRADVINLLRHGIKNVIAIEGTSIPEAIIELSKRKETTVFLDGDRGGDLILKELLEVADIDYIARAPKGKEVEELTKKEIYKCLRARVPVDQYKHEKEREGGNQFIKKPKVIIDPETRSKLKENFEKILGTRAAVLLDEDFNVLGRVPAKDIVEVLQEVRPYAVVIDEKVTQEVVDACSKAGVKYLAGKKTEERLKLPQEVAVLFI
jgi:DNA primase